MNVTGIIAEYNPFHNGHLYHLNEARRLTDADFIVAVMSGDYVQRGVPAVFHKYARARMALLSGADLVLEMPVFASAASAEDFAAGGIALLRTSGVVDHVCFGSESADLDQLKRQADLYDNETPEISARIKEGLKSGLSWPQARDQAIRSLSSVSIPSVPNDILGCEYIRAMNRQGASLIPVVVKRTDPGYHSEERAGAFASATAVRKALKENDEAFLSSVLPESFFSCIKDEPCPRITFDDFSLILNEKLLTMKAEELENTASMPKDLASKLYKNRRNFQTASNLTAQSKDRQYTYARVSRCLLNLTLGIMAEEVREFKAMGSAPWLRILGFRKEAAPLLSMLKKQAAAPVITKVSHGSKRLEPQAAALFEKHLNASELYRMVSEIKTGQSMKNEYTRSVIIL